MEFNRNLTEDPTCCIVFKRSKKDPDKIQVNYINIDETVQYILRNFNIITVTETKNIMLYHNGIYIDYGEAFVRQMLETLFINFKRPDKIPLLDIKTTSEIIAKIRNLTMHPLSEFDSDINIINMENGLYNLKDGKLEPHNPKYFSFIQVPVKYDPKAKCPAIQTVVTRVLKPEDVTKFYELLGYLMYRSYEVQKAFIFYGPGQSGKSMMLQIARTFVGDSNCSNVTFQQMAEDKFAVAELHNKLLNEAGDLDSTAIKTTGTFKMLTGGSRDMMRVQRKFGQPFDMSNFAKIVFATNILSAVHDDTTGFSRRVEIFICDNKFTLNPEDEQLLKDFQEPEEYSGLFNLVLPYLKHLLKTKRYTNETSAEDMYILYAAASNPTKAFLEFMVVESPESVITKNLLYDKYAKFCIKSHGRPVHFSQFGKRLIETYKDTIHTGQIRTGPGGKTRVYTWVGIRVREDGEELENDDKGILGIPST